MTLKNQKNKAQLLHNNETLTLNILINRFKKTGDFYVNDIDEAIEYFSYYVGE